MAKGEDTHMEGTREMCMSTAWKVKSGEDCII